MRLPGRRRGRRLLQAVICLTGAMAAAGAWAQTEVRKTLPEHSGSAQTEVKKTLPGQALQSGEVPTTPIWSTDVNERGVSATNVEVTGDARRTRFSLHLSSAVAYQIFTLAEPYRLIIDMPDVNFVLPKGAGQREHGLVQAFRYGLFAAGKSRVVIDTGGPVRIESAAVAKRPGSKAVVLNVDLAPTDGLALECS
jgi:AMIN domain